METSSIPPLTHGTGHEQQPTHPTNELPQPLPRWSQCRAFCQQPPRQKSITVPTPPFTPTVQITLSPGPVVSSVHAAVPGRRGRESVASVSFLTETDSNRQPRQPHERGRKLRQERHVYSHTTQRILSKLQRSSMKPNPPTGCGVVKAARSLGMPHLWCWCRSGGGRGFYKHVIPSGFHLFTGCFGGNP